MIFEEFVNNIKSINKIVDDEDMRDIESYIGFIEEKLNKIGRKNKDKLYSLIGDAINSIPMGYIIDLTAKENLGYKIASATELFDGDCYEDVYDCLNNNDIYVITNGKGFVKLMERYYLLKSDQYKHIINMLAHNYELILNNPEISDEYKEPIRKIENLFKVFSIKEN
jgi:hypothetical protein